MREGAAGSAHAGTPVPGRALAVEIDFGTAAPITVYSLYLVTGNSLCDANLATLAAVGADARSRALPFHHRGRLPSRPARPRRDPFAQCLDAAIIAPACRLICRRAPRQLPQSQAGQATRTDQLPSTLPQTTPTCTCYASAPTSPSPQTSPSDPRRAPPPFPRRRRNTRCAVWSRGLVYGYKRQHHTRPSPPPPSPPPIHVVRGSFAVATYHASITAATEIRQQRGAGISAAHARRFCTAPQLRWARAMSYDRRHAYDSACTARALATCRPSVPRNHMGCRRPARERSCCQTYPQRSHWHMRPHPSHSRPRATHRRRVLASPMSLCRHAAALRNMHLQRRPAARSPRGL